jgi:hypothetical protein
MAENQPWRVFLLMSKQLWKNRSVSLIKTGASRFDSLVRTKECGLFSGNTCDFVNTDRREEKAMRIDNIAFFLTD